MDTTECLTYEGEKYEVARQDVLTTCCGVDAQLCFLEDAPAFLCLAAGSCAARVLEIILIVLVLLCFSSLLGRWANFLAFLGD